MTHRLVTKKGVKEAPVLRGTNLEHARVHNLRTVLEAIRLHGPLSRADLARRTGLTAQTIGNLVTALLRLELVREAGMIRGARGRASTQLEIDGSGAYSIGVDLDRGHLTAVLVDIGGSVRERIQIDVAFPSPDRALDLVVDTVEALAARVQRERVWGVGVGFPGPLRIVDGVVDNVINPDGFPGWEQISVAERLSRRLDVDLYLENNATAAAVGESFYGAGRDLSSFFYVFLGVGLGGGIVAGGLPQRGWQGNAGEIGFTPTAAAPGTGGYLGQHFDLFRFYERLAARGVAASSPADLAALLERGHPAVLEWLDVAARHLAPALVTVTYLIDPEAVVVGGTWPRPLVDALWDRLEAELPSFRFAFMPYIPPLRRAEAGPDAAALGVATLPLSALLSPFPTSGPSGSATPAQHPLAATADA
jgi:predicted NBD/HSP70 family sugar kinase